MFSADWLAMREPADLAARAGGLTRAVADRFQSRRTLRALDLAAGTGANARYLAERISAPQEWLLADHDERLLAEVPRRMSVWALARGGSVAASEDVVRASHAGQPDVSFATRRLDLQRLDDPTLFSGRALVTASALLDLVSAAWLHELAGRCRDARATALFALTYDGRMLCSPIEPEDSRICDLVNGHQLTDKGFGAALGPGAAAAAERSFADRGYEVRRERSDWVLPPAAQDLQRHLVDGWAEAAASQAPSETAVISSWRSRRLAHIDQRRSRIVVGHVDLAAWPLDA